MRKVGDLVLIKSLDWYNTNKDGAGNIYYKLEPNFVSGMQKYCGKIFTISKINSRDAYKLEGDEENWDWSDYMFEDTSLLPGMLVEVKDKQNNQKNLAMITYGSELCISGPEVWFSVSRLDSNLVYKNYEVMKIYSRTSNGDAYKLDITNRSVLWSRKLKLTKQQIAEKFGINVEQLVIED